MKTNTLLFTFLIFISTSLLLHGQIEEKEIAMSLGNQNALTLKVENVDEKGLENYFKSYFRDYGKVKYNRKAKEHYIHDAKVKSVSSDKVDIYAKTIDVNNDILLALFIDNGLGFVNSDDYEDQYDGAVKILNDFHTYIKKSLIEDELREAEKNLSSIERDIKQLEKDNDRYHKTIEDARKKIAEMEEAIEKNIGDQEAKNQELEIHKEGIEEIKDRLKKVEKS